MLKGMQAGVAAVVLDVACSLGSNVFREKSAFSLIIMAGAFVCDFFLNVNVIYIIHGPPPVIGILRLWLIQSAKEGESMIYLQLFLSFIQVGLFSVGGG